VRCRGCKGDIGDHAVADAAVRAEAAKLYRNAEPMKAIAVLQRAAQLDLRTAKATVLHVTKKPARCHHCGEPVIANQSTVCAACGRVNLDW
jgi:hypothetical protein